MHQQVPVLPITLWVSFRFTSFIFTCFLFEVPFLFFYIHEQFLEFYIFCLSFKTVNSLIYFTMGYPALCIKSEVFSIIWVNFSCWSFGKTMSLIMRLDSKSRSTSSIFLSSVCFVRNSTFVCASRTRLHCVSTIINPTLLWLLLQYKIHFVQLLP